MRLFPLGLQACGEKGVWLQSKLQSQAPQIGPPDSLTDLVLGSCLTGGSCEGSYTHFTTNVLSICHVLGADFGSGRMAVVKATRSSCPWSTPILDGRDQNTEVNRCEHWSHCLRKGQARDKRDRVYMVGRPLCKMFGQARNR